MQLNSSFCSDVPQSTIVSFPPMNIACSYILNFWHELLVAFQAEGNIFIISCNICTYWICMPSALIGFRHIHQVNITCTHVTTST